MTNSKKRDRKDCPHCAESVHIEAIVCRFCDRGISESLFNYCPSCSEMIWRAAILCRYCRCAPLLEGFKNKEVTSNNAIDLAGKLTTRGSPFTQSPGKKKLMSLDDEAIDKIFKQNLGVE